MVLSRMNLRPVTDKKLLSQLENKPNENYLRPVTDQGLLNQLNNNSNNNFDPSFLEKLSPNIISGLAQMGHSILNAPSNIARYAASKGVLSPNIAEIVPRQQEYNFSEMLGLPALTESDKLIQAIAKESPIMAMPAANLGLLGKGLSHIPQVGKFISGAASRILPMSAAGAVMNENPIEGAKEYGGMQALLEGASIPVRMVGKVAEWMHPKEYTKQLISKIKDYYEKSKKEQKQAYDVPLQQYGYDIIHVSPNSVLSYQNKKLYPEARKIYEDFVLNPSVNNAHKLQSQIGKDISKLKDKPKTEQQFRSMRELLNTHIQHALAKDTQALNSYNKGIELTRDVISPMESTKSLRAISKGKTKELSPNQLNNFINTAYTGGKIPEQHFLNKEMLNLQNRINRGKAAQYIIPTVASSLTGGAMVPGLGHLGGAGAGALFAKYLEPGMIDFIQNPAIVNALKDYISPTVNTLGKIGLGYDNE